MNASTKIDKIVIDINGKKLELSTDQARDLMGVLKNLFNDVTIVTYSSPVYIQPNYTPWYTPWWGGTICQSQGASNNTGLQNCATANTLMLQARN